MNNWLRRPLASFIVLLAAGLLDLIGYAIFRFGLDRCYGLLCLMGG